MKVAFIIRSTAMTVPGGDIVQACETAAALRAMGVDVDIRPAGEPLGRVRYDLLHFFNITRPADILHYTRRSSIPFVVSTIFVQYGEYDKQYKPGIGRLFRALPPDVIEYLKTLARGTIGGDRIRSLAYLFAGQRNSILRVLHTARMLLPNSESEYRRLLAAYPCITPKRVVTNGADLQRARYSARKDDKLVICVARIEGVKNQLNLVRALNDTPFTLVLIGGHAPNQPGYYRRCREAARSNVHFAGHLPPAELQGWYARARVHVLPSWFETTGLSSIEAAASGCNVVITDRGDATEYFGDHAFYCDPASPESILDAVRRAASAQVSTELRTRCLEDYSWERAASQTLAAYREVLAS